MFQGAVFRAAFAVVGLAFVVVGCGGVDATVYNTGPDAARHTGPDAAADGGPDAIVSGSSPGLDAATGRTGLDAGKVNPMQPAADAMGCSATTCPTGCC